MSDPRPSLPLTAGQRGLWFRLQLAPGYRGYNQRYPWLLQGELDVEAVRRAVTGVVARHAALRTRFVLEGDDPMRIVEPPAPVPVPLIPLTGGPGPAEEALDRYVDTEGVTPFDLTSGPPLRVSLLRLAEDRHVLLLSVHHLVFDGRSAGVFRREFAELYEAAVHGREARLPAPDRSEPREEEAGFAAQLDYWRDRLSGLEPLALRGDRPRPAVRTGAGAIARVSLGGEEARLLRKLGGPHQATLFMTGLTAFQILLSRFTGQRDLSVGVASAVGAGTASRIGFAVNTLVVRADLTGEPGFGTLLERTRDRVLEAFAHGDVPFEDVVRELRPELDPGRTPLFQAMFGVERRTNDTMAGVEVSSYPLRTQGVNTDLAVSLVHRDGGLDIEVTYDTELFEPGWANRFADGFRNLLSALAATGTSAGIEDLPVLTGPHHALLDAPAVAPPESVTASFDRWVARAPGAPAVVCGPVTLPYAELDRRAHLLAGKLRALGAGPGTRVGVSGSRSPGLVVGLLAVLRTGGTYVPLDPAHPVSRTRWTLEDAGVRLVVAEDSPEALERFAGVTLVSPSVPDGVPDLPRPVEPSRDPAYLIYTSGSSGTPKGVEVDRGALATHLSAVAAAFGVHHGDRIAQIANSAFDVSLEQILVPLVSGAACVVITDPRAVDETAAELLRTRPTVLNVTPSYADALLAELDGLDGAGWAPRLLVLGAETLTGAQLTGWRARFPSARVVNAYGPTEGVVTATAFTVPANWSEHGVPIGTPLDGRTAHVLDDRLRPVPAGATGELYLGGDALAGGYSRRAAHTAERFIAAPGGRRWYRTGDLVRLRESGDLEFLGRADEQVKIRGHRVEPAEIESALAAHPDVGAVVVTVRDGRLIAHFTGGAESLRDFARSVLPGYLVPAFFIPVDRLPLTPNGKVDRAALPAPAPEPAGGHRPPATAAERAVAKVWQDVLSVPLVGRDDDFFALGGHSLTAGRVIARLRTELGTSVGMAALFRHRTLAEFAAATTEAASLRPLTDPDTALLSANERRLLLAHQLDPDSAEYVITLAYTVDGPLDETALRRALTTLSGRHLALRTRYRIGAGEPVRLIDPPGPATLHTLDRPSAGIEAFLATEAATPIDLETGPLVRFSLVNNGSAASVFVVAVHHIVFDGWSAQVFLNDLAELYAGRALPGDAAQVSDFASWQRQALLSTESARLHRFWADRLRGVGPLVLPTDRPRPPLRSTAGAVWRFTVPAALRSTVEETATAQGITPFVLGLAAWQVTLARLGGHHDFAVGTVSANREHAEFDGVIGCLVNTVAVRADLADSPGDLLSRTRDQVVDALAGQDLPFDEVVRAAGGRRDPGRHPLYQTMFTLEHRPAPPRLGDAVLRRVPPPSAAAKEDITLSLVFDEGATGIAAALTYATSLFDENRVARMAEGFLRALEDITGGADLKLGRSAPAARISGRTPHRSTLAPRTPAERALATIWAETLGHAEVGIDENFFDLGGDSLLAGKIAARARSVLGAGLRLRDLFECPTIAALAGRIAGAPAPPAGPEASLAGEHRRELSSGERRLWLAQRLDPDSVEYTVPLVYRLPDEVDLAGLRRALTDIVRRHEVLRTRYVVEGDEPVALVDPTTSIAIEVLDVGCLDDAVEAELRRPFDLAAQPPIRTRVLRSPDGERRLVVSMHHIAVDGWSVAVLLRELAVFTTGGKPPAPARRFADHVRWERSALESGLLAGSEQFWRAELTGVEPLALPTDRPRPALRSANGDVVRFTIPAPLRERAEALSRHSGVTLFMTGLAAFHVLLSRWSGQHDVTAAITGAHRDHAEYADVMGYFATTVVIRADLGEDPPFAEFLARTRERVLTALSHQALPFDRVVRAVAPPRDPSRTPLYQAMFALETGATDLRLGEATLARLPLKSLSAKEDLGLTLAEDATTGDLVGHLVYATDLFDRATAARLAESYAVLLAGAVAAPGTPVRDLPLLSDGERARVAALRAPAPESPPPVHQAFEQQVLKTPGRAAVRFDGVDTDYAELNRRANRLAHRLRAAGAGTEVTVAVCLPRSADTVAALLAVLKSGGTYLPLDPAYPDERLRWTLADTAAAVLVTTGDVAGRFGGLDLPVVRTDTLDDIATAENPEPLGGPRDAAYVIHTSGSTGTPKGVVVEHRSLAAHCQAARELYALDGDRVLQLASTSFDASLEQILPALTSGSTVVLRGDDVLGAVELAGTLADDEITVCELTPAYWEDLVTVLADGIRPAPPSLRLLVLGGDTVPAGTLRRWLAATDIPVVNTYGPTESTITATAFTAHRDWTGERVPIGVPFPGREVRLLDDRLVLVPGGVVGEVYLGGAGVARGYLGRPGLTAQRFVADPWGPPGARLYRTGDLARLRSDDTLEFHGRADRQVKIRGFRIEPGEIESALTAHPAVRAAAVIAREDVPGDRKLAAYLTGVPVDTAELRRFLASRLPGHLVPSVFVQLAELPLTTNGKLDEARLPAPAGHATPPDAVPESPTEQAVARIFAEVLGVTGVGALDDFFGLGGHSLAANRVCARAHAAFGIELPLPAVFRHPTVRDLATVVEELVWARVRDMTDEEIAEAVAAHSETKDR
ncbi:amino acid adenylation domain-containing protein [Amycolatopsis sp. cmx-11-12]|uniref:amino acid adenylation domain-containing protein n=1 Tax=Amycolatopsis sp. cmx-11-12 TaxID=2785795 RepID=UPI003917EB54